MPQDAAPAFLAPDTDALDQCLGELQGIRQWILWSQVMVKGRWTKKPHGTVDNDVTWKLYVKARDLYRNQRPNKEKRWAGFGFVFTKDDPYCGIDLDKCRDPDTGELQPWAAEIVAKLASYAEVSPSGRGVKIIVKAARPAAPAFRHRAKVNGGPSEIECYDRDRFFTLTGRRVAGTPPQPIANQAAVDWLLATYLSGTDSDDQAGTRGRGRGGRSGNNGTSHGNNGTTSKPRYITPSSVPAALDDTTIIDRIHEHPDGPALWSGGESEDLSTGDMALVNHIAFFTGADESRIDSIFRQSGRVRDKWDKVHYASGETYGQHTIRQVLNSKKDFHDSVLFGGTVFKLKKKEPIAAAPAIANGSHGESNGHSNGAVANGVAHPVHSGALPQPSQPPSGATSTTLPGVADPVWIPDEIPPIANYRTIVVGESEVRQPIPSSELRDMIYGSSNRWPRVCAGALFVHHPGQVNPEWIQSPADLMSFMQDQFGIVDWRTLPGCVTKEELRSTLIRNGLQYDSIEIAPHHPPIPGVYYTCPAYPSGDGKALAGLLDQLSPETEVDRELIIAMMLTAFWGGMPGTRPLFAIGSQLGSGMGKSTLIDVIKHIVGSPIIDLSPNADFAVVQQRLLSPAALICRIVRWDNVKSFRLSSGEMEHIITAETISGKRLYVGEACRPNNMLWTMTMNGISLSEDMAQRSIIIHVSKNGTGDGNWRVKLMTYIETHRHRIIADLLAILRRPAKPIKGRLRWETWMTEILGRVEHPLTCLELIHARQAESNATADEHEIVNEFFARQLEELNYDPETDAIHIPCSIASIWFSEATGEKRSTVAAGRILSQAIASGKLNLVKNPSRASAGRGYIWQPTAIERWSTVIYDIESRIRMRGVRT